MKHKKRIIGLVIVAVFMMSGKASYAQPETNSHKTLSPYFLVKSRDPDVDRLPLKSTWA